MLKPSALPKRFLPDWAIKGLLAAGSYKMKKARSKRTGSIYGGGELGIRTPDTLLAYTRFPIVLLKPDSYISPAAALPAHARMYFTPS